MRKHLPLMLLLGACASGPEGGDSSVAVPSHRKPSSDAKVYYAKNGWNIRSVSDIPKDIGTVEIKSGVIHWDLKGAILDGKNQKGDGSQDENQEPLFRARVPLVVKKGFARNVKNALSFFAKDSGVERMTFLSFGEDAVATAKGRSTSVRAYNFRVIDCEFINKPGNDKSLQMNEAKDAIVEGNLFYSGRTCMRIGDSDTTQTSDVATVKNNRFLACDTGTHASRISVKTSNNKFEKVKTPWKGSNGAKEE